MAAAAVADGETEVSILMPAARVTPTSWHRFLHDHTADDIAQALAAIQHCNVTIVPYHLGSHYASPSNTGPEPDGKRRLRRSGTNGKRETKVSHGAEPPPPDDHIAIADVQYRQHTRVAGRIHTMRVQPHGGVPSLECTLVDDTGGIALVFLGRRSIPGLKVGARITVEGTAGENRGHLAILNPIFEFLPDYTPKH